MGKFSPLFTCCVCGVNLGNLTREDMRKKGMSSKRRDGSELHHCPSPMHAPEQIIEMANARPRFTKANEITYADNTTRERR